MLYSLTTRLPAAFEGPPPAAVLTYEPPVDAEDEYAALADLVAPVVRGGDVVLAILDERTAEPLHARLQAVRSALETTRLLVHTTDLPPLATALLVRALHELDIEGVLPASVIASGIRRLEDLVVGAAWLGSVSKLQHPSPSLKLHARSYLPGGGYAAVLGDEPRVVRHKNTDEPLPLPPMQPATDWRVVVGTGLADESVVEPTLGTALAGAEVVRVASRRSSVAWWGTEKLVEIACMPRALDRLRHVVLAGAGTRACGWCGHVVATPSCPLCGAARAAASPVSGAVT